MASTSSSTPSTPVTLSSTLSLPKSCTSHTANKIENLVEYSYIPESAQISESSYPLISPYQLYKRPGSFTRSIRTLISTRRPQPKEYIQSSRLDQCSLQATSAEQYVTLEIPSELISNWKREGYTHLHLRGIRLILTLHGRKGLPVTARITMLDTQFKRYQDVVIGTVLTTLHAGSVLLTFYPNFNLSLQDTNLPTALKVQVQIQGAEQISSAKIATLHHQLVYRLQNHALDLPTPEHHSDTLMISNYEQFHNNTAPIQTSESIFERCQDGTVRMTFKPPPSAPQEPPRLSFTYTSMITAVQTAQEDLPNTGFNSEGYLVYPAKQNGHFPWDVPGFAPPPTPPPLIQSQTSTQSKDKEPMHQYSAHTIDHPSHTDTDAQTSDSNLAVSTSPTETNTDSLVSTSDSEKSYADITRILMAQPDPPDQGQTSHTEPYVDIPSEVEEEMLESSTTNQPPPAQAQYGPHSHKSSNGPWFTFDDIPSSKWRDRLNEMSAWIDLQMLRPEATTQLVLGEFATRLTGALRDWFDSLGQYRQLQFVQLPEVSSALAVIHDQFLGDPSAVFEAARRDYLNMKCCSLNAKDLDFHYKCMSLLFYKLNGFNEPTIKHIAKTCLDKLCEQKQFFKELLKDKEPFRSACKRPYLQIKCKKKKDCDCSPKKKRHFRKFKTADFSSRRRRSRKSYRFFRKKSSSSREFKWKQSSRCFICKKKCHYAKDYPNKREKFIRLVEHLQATTDFSPEQDELEFYFSEQDAPNDETVFALQNSFDDSDSDQSQVIFHQQLLSLDTTVPIPSIKLHILPSKFQRPIPAIALIDTGSHDEHRQLLSHFYDIVQTHGIMLSAKKSTIATDNIEFLSMIIKDGHYQPGKHIAQELLHFPDQQLSKKQVQQFLGITNYIRDFIPHVDHYTHHLSALLKKKPPAWNADHTTAVITLKQIAQNLPPLKLITDGKCILQTDASDESWGAILLEEINGKEHFIAYASGQFSNTQKHYHSVFKEILAVKRGIKKFEYHLIGHHFLIQMDSSAFPNILNFKGKTVLEKMFLRLKDWFSKYDFSVKHIKGSQNLIPDMLSRLSKPEKPLTLISTTYHFPIISNSFHNQQWMNQDPPPNPHHHNLQKPTKPLRHQALCLSHRHLNQAIDEIALIHHVSIQSSPKPFFQHPSVTLTQMKLKAPLKTTT
ncbi:hypothetical protein KPL71_021652 [Citrus sinensis]|uniref:Uncharacterized protein n=1 Tax=Citrus sinensis TaxID=2711 RepID=A0ACB8JJH9_CITSI|nr:hypothetical protein KPL71_021652 [Citrus sinensis]